MQYLNLIVSIVCVSAVTLFTIAIIMSTFELILVRIHGLQKNKVIDAEDRTIRDVGRRLVDSSYWFSESPETYQLLKYICESLRDKKYISVVELREQWRDMLKESEKGKNNVDV